MAYSVSSAKLNMMDNKVLVKPVDPDEMTKGGIALPDIAQEKTREGTVISVGPGKMLKDGSRGEMQVKEGDRILFEHYNTNDILIDGEEYRIMFEPSILAKLN